MCIFCTPWTQYMHGYINEITSQIYINKWYQTGPFDFFQQTLLDECWLGSKPYKHMIFQMLLDNGPSAVTLFRPCKCPPPFDRPLIVYTPNLSIVKVLVNGFIASYMGWSKFKRTFWVGRKHNVESNHTLVTVLLTKHGGRWWIHVLLHGLGWWPSSMSAELLMVERQTHPEL